MEKTRAVGIVVKLETEGSVKPALRQDANKVFSRMIGECSRCASLESNAVHFERIRPELKDLIVDFECQDCGEVFPQYFSLVEDK